MQLKIHRHNTFVVVFGAYASKMHSLGIKAYLSGCVLQQLSYCC